MIADKFYRLIINLACLLIYFGTLRQTPYHTLRNALMAFNPHVKSYVDLFEKHYARGHYSFCRHIIKDMKAEYGDLHSVYGLGARLDVVEMLQK